MVRVKIPKQGEGSGVLKSVALSVVLVFTVAVATHVHFAQTQTFEKTRTTQTSDGHTLRGSTGENQKAKVDQCRFYLAESAIPKSGFGLFTTVDIKEGDQAQFGPDICIYVADTPKDTHFETHSWARDVFFGSFEGRNPRAACEGFATLFNSMPKGIQTSKLAMLSSHDNAGLQRQRDPGAGAVSHYFGISSIATRPISAGAELTIDYGDWRYRGAIEDYTAPARSVSWIRKHGMCIDNIQIRRATDPAMGRGAFASRSLKKGTLVAPAPLQLFPNRSDFAQQTPEALFVNYCLQAPGSDMLLYPYGPGVNMINHSSKTPNVKLQWSSHHMNHAQWLSLPLPQLLQMDYPGSLLLDVVALRDIQEGEELFLDYGDSWQKAWDEHVASWQPVQGEYVYAGDMDLTQPFKTVEEQDEDPYPANLKTVCHTPNWNRDDFSKKAWRQPRFDFPEGLLYCNILSRTKNNQTSEWEYEVSLNFDESRPDRRDTLKYIDTGVPHRAIFFVDKPYQSDLHLPNAFRHTIGLPVNLVPDHWATDV